MTVTSGRRCAGLLKKSDPVGSWLRMCLASLRWRSTRCYLTWKPSATPSGRLLFRLVPSMPRIGENAYGFWRTPNSTDGEGGVMKMHKDKAGHYKLRDHVQPMNAQMWPTPSSNSGTGGATGLAGGQGNRKKLYKMLGEKAGKQMGCQSLNPYWVEWLMGFPLGWTALKPSATPSSRRSPRKSDG